MSVIKRLQSLTSRVEKARNELLDSIADVRSELDKLKAERDRIASAPKTAEEIAAAVRQFLDAAQRDAQQTFIPTSFGTNSQDAASPEVNSLFRWDPVGALCALGLREAIEATLVERAQAACPDGIASEMRKAELARLDKQIADIERAEEQMLREADRAGFSIPRRIDADPAALLMKDGADAD